MFKKFEVIYARNLEDLDSEMYYPTKWLETKEDKKIIAGIHEDVTALKTLFTKPSYKERFVVKYRVTWFWLFYTEHKLYLRSRTENGAIAQAKKFALGDK